MIGAIGDVTHQYLVRANYSDDVDQRAVVKQKDEVLRSERPVETAGDCSKTESATKRETTEKNEYEDGKIVFKRYNKTGDVIYRVPPESINKNV